MNPARAARGPELLQGSFVAVRGSRERVHIVVPAGTHVAEMPEMSVHRSHRLLESDVLEIRGMRMTTAARSALDAARIMERAGYPRPRRQVALVTTARKRRVDLAVDLGENRLLIVEVEGPPHDSEDVRLLDAVTDAAAIAEGHHVLRIPASASRQHPERLLLEFRELRKRLL